jgi:hypothetical protein
MYRQQRFTTSRSSGKFFNYYLIYFFSNLLILQFESHIKRRLGTVELSDQVEVLKIIAKEMGFIDLNRVAIHGKLFY